MFAPNALVVCVDDKFPLGIEQILPNLPKEGEVYTIRDIVPGISLKGEEGEVAVYLCEIVNPKNKHGIERGFNGERFAPIETIETEEEEDEEKYLPKELVFA